MQLDLFSWTPPAPSVSPARIAEEIKRRINVAVWAYAYELENDSLVSDQRFDSECRLVDLSIDTGRPDMDAWFRANFDPCTGQWVHAHPDKNGLHRIYLLLKSK